MTYKASLYTFLVPLRFKGCYTFWDDNTLGNFYGFKTMIFSNPGLTQHPSDFV